MKNVTEICKEVAKREGKKKEVNIAQIKEIVGIICDLIFEHKIEKILEKNGKRRAKRV